MLCEDSFRLEVVFSDSNISLKSYVGIEPTLWMVTILALEALGGSPDAPLDGKERTQYSKRISEEEYLGRCGRRKSANIAVIVLAVIALPISAAMNFVLYFLRLFKMIWQAWISPGKRR